MVSYLWIHSQTFALLHIYQEDDILRAEQL